MTDDDVLELMENDLREAPGKKILYLEGKTDVAPLFALLGVAPPLGDLHEGVLVRGLEGRAGSKTVLRFLRLASANSKFKGVRGLIDGDGRSLDVLDASFHGSGPRFDWPAYCIENLLAQADGWPEGWGEAPDWDAELGRLASLAAINRLISAFGDELRAARLREFWKTDYPKPLLSEAEMIELLTAARARIEGYPLIERFKEELGLIRADLARSTEVGHTVINGKWLLKQLARERAGGGASEDRCRALWCEAVAAAGGHPRVKAWWARMRA